MKKSLVKEYESLIRPHVSELYARAYAVKGNPAEAEVLTVDAIVWGASKFSGLAKKERIVELISSHIGDGTHIPAESADEDAIVSRAMKRINEKGKLKTLILGVGSCVLALAILAVSIPNLPYDEWFPEETTSSSTETDAEGNVIQPVIGSVTMKKTDTIKGDNERITLANYHNLSETLDKKTVTFDGRNDNNSRLERYTATVTASDGTAYLAFTDMPNNKSADNNTVTLYRMEKDGWKALGSCEAQVNYAPNSLYGPPYMASRLYLETDADSNVYLFCILDKSITVHKYDCKTGEFQKAASLKTIYKPMRASTFSTYYDPEVGESGAFYIAYLEYELHFAYYDIAKNEFVKLSQEVGVSGNLRKFCVKDGVIHVVEQKSTAGLLYYRVNADGTVNKKTLFQSDGIYSGSEDIDNIGVGAGGIAVDENGIVHIVAASNDGKSVQSTVHYTIAEDLTVEKEYLPKLYYQESEAYLRHTEGLIVGEDGGLYYIEAYRYSGTSNLLSVAKLSETAGEVPTLVDVIEIPDSMDQGLMHLRDATVVFFSDNDIYYFEIEGLGD